MTADLKDFFSVIGKAKKEKEDEFRSLVGELDIDSMFSQVKVSVEEEKKKKEKQIKQVKALEAWLFSDPKKKEETIEEETIEEETIEEEVVDKIKEDIVEELLDNEVEEEIVEEVEEDTIDHALKILETIKSKEEVQENIGDPEIIKIRRELEYLKNLVNAQGGGGEVRLEFLDDIDKSSAKVDGKFLQYQESTGKWIGADASGGGDTAYASVAGIATYAILSGIATYATNSGVSTNSTQLNGQNPAYYLDYTNFTNTPSIPTNNNELTNGAGYVTSDGSVAFASTSGISTVSQGLTGTPNIVVGIATATSFIGDLTGDVTGNADTSTTATSAQGLSGTPDITVNNIVAVAATFTGNVTIGGTLTYEDVTNIDSVGLITARSGIEIGGPVILNINTATSTKTSTSQDSIDVFSASTYRSANYQVQITRGTDYHVTTLNILHDGTNVFVSEFGTIRTGESLASFTADIDSGNVRILVTPTSETSTVFKLYRNLIRV